MKGLNIYTLHTDCFLNHFDVEKKSGTTKSCFKKSLFSLLIHVLYVLDRRESSKL